MREHGTDGYILQIDIKKYFDSVDHEVLKQLYRKEVHESPDIMNLIDYIIDTSSKTDKGLNLGSECPQIFAVYYLHPIDIWMKCVCREHYYGRYMDDGYLIHKDKEHLIECLEKINKICDELGIRLNKNKTQIIKLSKGFVFLKSLWQLLPKGKVLVKASKSNIVRERRKLKKFKPLLNQKTITLSHIEQSFNSWKSCLLHTQSFKQIANMQKLYIKLFGEYYGNQNAIPIY